MPVNIEVTHVDKKPLPIKDFNALPKHTISEIKTKNNGRVPVPADFSDKELDLWNKSDPEDRSGHLFTLATILQRKGLSREIIHTILTLHPLTIEKYPGREPEEIQRILSKVFAEEEVESKAIALWSYEELLSKNWRVEWAIENIWTRNTVGFISGPPKSYKSFTSLDLAVSVASGTPFLGKFKVLDPGPVVVIQEEDPPPVIRQRLDVIAHSRGLGAKYREVGPRSLEFEFPDLPIYVSASQGFRLQEPDEMHNHLQKIRPKFIIFDPLINIVGEIDEYKGSQVADALKVIKDWRNEFDCSIVIVTHDTKHSSEDRGGRRMYGSFAFHAFSESSLYVRPVIDKSGPVRGIIAEREFKAAATEPEIQITFEIDTEDKFLYQVSIETNIKPEIDQIEELIKISETPITVDQVSKMLDMGKRNVGRRIKKLLDDGKVEVRVDGGKQYYTWSGEC